VEQTGNVSVLQEISNRRDSWISAINEGDADGFVAVLWEDAVWLPWGQPAIAGKHRIRDWLSVPFSEYSYDYSVSDVRVRVAGDWAVERARFRTRAVDRNGIEAPIHKGEYTLLWRRTPAAKWVIERYIDQTRPGAA
jgi:uncharacterized protein (TIGR02246 family)